VSARFFLNKEAQEFVVCVFDLRAVLTVTTVVYKKHSRAKLTWEGKTLKN
jgi:hypothetical protein